MKRTESVERGGTTEKIYERPVSTALTAWDVMVFTQNHTYVSNSYCSSDEIAGEFFSGGSAFTSTYNDPGYLTSVKENGILKIRFTYDAMGNPLTYYNGVNYTFTWKNGRQLATANFGTTMSFEYNDDGIRTSKTVNGVKHTYHLYGSQIVAEEWGDRLCIYIYDESGSPIGMQYRTTSYAEGVFDTFWFEKNLQGDIVAVYNNAGTLLDIGRKICYNCVRRIVAVQSC